MKNQLIELIIQQNNKSDKGRLGLLKGKKELRNLDENADRLDIAELLKEAKQLRQEGMIQVKFFDGYSAIEKVWYYTEYLPELYRRAGQELPWETLSQYQLQVTELMEGLHKDWIWTYCKEELLGQLAKGRTPKNLLKKHFLECLRGLDEITEPIFKRVFSIRYLDNSKEFERELEDTVITIAKNYCPDVEAEMESSEILSQVFIQEYSQVLWIKGNLKIELCGKVIDFSGFLYGAALNSQTLKFAKILPEQEISKVITVENKANFESMVYEEHTLIIFTHGFLAPLEREFLNRVVKGLPESGVSYYHTSDLDLGGVNIFRHIRTKIMPKVKPLRMDVETFRKYREKGYGEKIEKKAYLNKLKKMEEPLLQELIEEMVKEEWVIEQECFLI